MRYTAIGAMMLLFLTFGCARQPSPARTAKLLQHHFVRYGKRYATSPFGQSPVSGVELRGTEEIRRHFVSATATVAFQDGRHEAVRCSLEQKLPLGWRVVSWERLTP